MPMAPCASPAGAQPITPRDAKQGSATKQRSLSLNCVPSPSRNQSPRWSPAGHNPAEDTWHGHGSTSTSTPNNKNNKTRGKRFLLHPCHSLRSTHKTSAKFSSAGNTFWRLQVCVTTFAPAAVAPRIRAISDRIYTNPLNGFVDWGVGLREGLTWVKWNHRAVGARRWNSCMEMVRICFESGCSASYRGVREALDRCDNSWGGRGGEGHWHCFPLVNACAMMSWELHPRREHYACGY